MKNSKYMIIKCTCKIECSCNCDASHRIPQLVLYLACVATTLTSGTLVKDCRLQSNPVLQCFKEVTISCSYCFTFAHNKDAMYYLVM